MIHTIDADKLKFLNTAVTQWEEQNLLTREQSQQLLAIYRTPDKREKAMGVVLTAAVLLTGRLINELVTHNQIDITTKYFVLLALMIAMSTSFYFGWKKIQIHTSTYVGEALLTLGAMCYAVGIALSTQMFNWTSTVNLECAAFLAGIAGLAVLCRSHTLAVITACGGIVVCTNNDVPCPYRYLTIALMLVATYAARNRWALAITLSSMVWLALVSPPNESVKNMLGYDSSDYVRSFLLGCALFAWYHRHCESPRLRSMAAPYLFTSVLVFFTLISQTKSGGTELLHPELSISSIGIILATLISCIKPIEKLSSVSVASFLTMTIVVVQIITSHYMPLSEVGLLSSAILALIAGYCVVFHEKFLHLSALIGIVGLLIACYSDIAISFLNPLVLPCTLVLLSISAVFLLRRKLQRTSSNSLSTYALNQTIKGL